MALSYSVSDTFKLIVSKDDSIDHEKSDYELYAKTLDESHLVFIKDTEPTRFVIKSRLSYQNSELIKSKQIKMKIGGESEFNIGYVLDEVRYSLIDIENPSYLKEDQKIKFEKDKDGYASKDLITKLEQIGIIYEITNARANISSSTSKTEDLKKKS